MSFAVIQGEESGYTAPWIVTLFVLCGLSGIAFVVTERTVKSPMLDLSMFRRPPFAGSNFVAFVAYFGTFSIFFFTALYLQVVANASAYQTAVDFLPMAAGLIIASALTGPLVARYGPRWCPWRSAACAPAAGSCSPTLSFRRLSTWGLWAGSSRSPASASACCWCP
jgi:predicted MFS family arabinose efflux permease